MRFAHSQLVALFLVAFTCLVKPTQAQPSNASALAEAIRGIEIYPDLYTAAKPILDRIPEYEKEIDSAKAFAIKQRLTVNIIGQSHYVNGVSPEIEARVRSSQSQVLALLEQQKPEVIAMENLEFPSITMADFRKALFANCLPMAQGDSAKANEGVSWVINWSGSLQYADAHQRVRLVSSEDMPLHDLHELILKYVPPSDPASPSTSPEGQLELAVSRMRSELGLAKVILVMKQIGGTRGALAIGANHLSHYDDILPEYKMTTHTYNTTQ